MNHWLLEFLMNYRPFELLLNDFLMLFMDDGLRYVMNDFSVSFVDDGLMNLTDLLLVDDRLVVLVNHVLVLLVDYILMMLMHYVLMVLMDDVLVMLLDDGLADVSLDLDGQNVLLDLSGYRVFFKHCFLIMANHSWHRLVCALDNWGSLSSGSSMHVTF